MRRRLALSATCTVLLLAGCGDDDAPTTSTAPTSATTGASSATGPTTTSTGTTAGGATTTSAATPGGAPPAATASQVAALPAGLVPGASGSSAEDEAALADLRTRLARAPSAMRRAGSARYVIDLTLSSGPVRGPGVADFRSGASLSRLTVGSGAGATAIEQYNDGTVSYSRSGGSAWSRETSLIPNSPGNSTGLLARQLRVGRAGAEATVDGVRCRWAAGVVPLRELLVAGGAADAPPARALLQAAKAEAVYPIGACVSEDGLLAELRYDVAFDRDLGLAGAPGRETFRGTIRFRDLGDAPAVARPSGLPTG